MIAKPIYKGETIGICSPCHVADREVYRIIIENIEKMGYMVKEAPNMYKDTYGYIASPEERAFDINFLFSDDDVDMILFGGGEGSNEVVPLIDYELIRTHPKRICAFSDATSILNAIWSMTGLETYYGLSPSAFEDNGLSDYNRLHFEGHLASDDMKEHIKASSWHKAAEGSAEGILFGGYALNVALMINTPYFKVDEEESYILLIEDYEDFGEIGKVSALLTHIEQSHIMKNIKGVLFGQYSKEYYPELTQRLKRLGERHGIPCAYCEDFGHADNRAIFPIGHRVSLDTLNNELIYL